MRCCYIQRNDAAGKNLSLTILARKIMSGCVRFVMFAGPTIMRIDKETDIDGSPTPEEPFTSLGLGSQFDSSAPYDSGYQIKPRRREDVHDGEDCGSTPVVEKTWGQIKDRYR